jgi:predicted transcriptional regulator
MPAKGTTRVGDARRGAIARARLAGKPSRAIAREVGLAPDTVRRQMSDPRTVSLIRELKAEQEGRLRKSFERACQSIEKHLESRRAGVVRDARRDLVRILEAGEPAKVDVSPGGDCQLEELLTVYRRVSIGETPG